VYPGGLPFRFQLAAVYRGQVVYIVEANAPAHTVAGKIIPQWARDAMEKHNIHRSKWPQHSPDLNMHESRWDDLMDSIVENETS